MIGLDALAVALLNRKVYLWRYSQFFQIHCTHYRSILLRDNYTLFRNGGRPVTGHFSHRLTSHLDGRSVIWQFLALLIGGLAGHKIEEISAYAFKRQARYSSSGCGKVRGSIALDGYETLAAEER